MLRRTSALAACAAVLVLSACGGGDSTTDDPKEDASKASGNTTTCAYPTDNVAAAAREVEAPETEAPAEGTVEAVIETNRGDIGLTLDREGAPCTVQSFVSLAEQGFYDDTPCPRLGNAPGFGILQCGDPSGTMGGGPGYSFADELSGDETYPAGTLAMANAGPDTNGSQFFLVFTDSQFNPDYTVFGTIDADGLKVLAAIAEKGDDGSNPAGGGAPKEPVQIEKVTVG